MTLPLSMEAYRAEKARREVQKAQGYREEIRARCKKSFAEFVKAAWHIIEPATPLVWGWHLDAMCIHLQAITEGRLHPRLIGNVPPGSSKSTIFSVMWPAFEWGPAGMAHLRYLCTSYNDDAMIRDNRKMRKLVQSDWYQTLWPEVKLIRWAQWDFENSMGGSRLAAPFGSLTSLRADRLILDDPHSTTTAESETVRNETTRQFREGALDRINDLEKSAILLVMQRLHQRDLTGVILDEMPEQGFVHLMIPMRFEVERKCVTPIWEDPRTQEGELMEPQRFTPAAVDKMEIGKGAYAWAGQYLQRPAPRDGGKFETAKIIKVPHAPGIPQYRVRGWDIAGSSRKTSPYTVGVRMCVLDGVIYIEDVRRLRAEIDAAERLIIDTARDDGRAILQSCPQDPGQAGKSQRNHMSLKLSKASGNFRFSTETGSKEDRALPLASMVNAGQVRIVDAPWNQSYLEELQNFPSGAFKDQVDASSRAYDEIVRLIGPDDSDDLPALPQIFQTSGADDEEYDPYSR